MRETAGLSILLEGYHNATHNKSPQVINKTLSIKPPSPPSLLPSSPLPAITFLDSCFLCKQKLLPGNDIYMYKGDRAFCSVECRCRQIFMDEECVSVGREMNCSFAARKPINGTSPASSSSAASSRRRSKGNKSRSDWFAY